MTVYLKPPERREVFILDDAETDPRYGWRPEERPVDVYLRYAAINLDKPVGPSSHEVVAWLKRILGIEKIAHAGTLEG